MGVVTRLQRLDARVLPFVRRPGESAVDYLQRYAARRWYWQLMTPWWARADVDRAIREVHGSER